MTTHKIKINLNAYHEFSSMIDSCANIPDEDNSFDGLFTALYDGELNKRHVLVTLNAAQIKQLIHFSDKQINYLSNITIPQLNDDQNYSEANACRYTIKGLRKLIELLTTKVSA